jgi:transaldolase
MNPLIELHAYGQSFWYDNIQRRFLLDGTLQNLIEVDGLRGMTSNPTIFEKAISSGDEYDEQLNEVLKKSRDLQVIYEALALTDIRLACDLFADLYQKSKGGDGYVSLEVSPHLAHYDERTVAEARRLFAAVDRPNVMIKVPATPQGVPAIRQLISEGVNINVTLMFSMHHYEAVARAYLDGLRKRARRGQDLDHVASVASFFVSRVDTAVDKILADIDDPAASALLGKTAIANSKIVYQRFKELFHGEDFDELNAKGAAVQRLLWASTSTKNPDYPDTLYVDGLIGPETVNTMPPKTIDAFRDHGHLSQSLEEDVEEAQLILDNLVELGIDLDDVTEQLQEDGVKSFSRSFDQLIEALSQKVSEIRTKAK